MGTNGLFILLLKSYCCKGLMHTYFILLEIYLYYYHSYYSSRPLHLKIIIHILSACTEYETST